MGGPRFRSMYKQIQDFWLCDEINYPYQYVNSSLL